MKRHRTWIEISEKALAHNIDALRGLLSPSSRFCAIVKANAYGHGLKEVATIAARHGVDAFGVDHIDDALILREMFPSALIIVLGYTMFDRFKEAVNSEIHVTLYDAEGLEAAQRTGSELAKSFHVHLKLETGTVRQGIDLGDLQEMCLLLQRSPHIVVAGVATHFANIEDSENPDFAAHQFEVFEEGIGTLNSYGIHPLWKHCACSAAIILYPQTHQTLVRGGISMYGIWSSELVHRTVRKLGSGFDLEPVLTWKTRVAQVKRVEMGTPIGYGLTEVMKRTGRLAVLPVGYWDGYRRSLSSIGEVLIRGQRCKVMGRVFMNMIVVDVSSIPSVQKEDEVLLLGTDGRHRVSADDLATLTSTIPYEVLANINPSLPRIIV